jgi:uncharacterized protein
MDVTPLIPAGRQIIESYGGGRFRVSGRTFEGSILILPDRTIEWQPASIAALTPDDLPGIAEAGWAGTVELVLIGGGPRPMPAPAPLRQALRAAGVVVETMDTGAACRTYNVLMSEGRRVAAALIAVA